MSLATRVILILTLILPITCGLSAQQTTTTAETSSTSAAVSEGAAATEAPAALSSHEVRNQFDSLIRQRPPELGIILATEPALLSNDGFLGGYPELARFVAAHPEVRTNPGFYLSSFRVPRESRVFDRILEAVEIGSVFLFMAFVLAWLVRTVIEQRRWSRLSRTQTEVHNKILDRFGTSQELLEYVRSSAGTKFLESAPIALLRDAARRASRHEDVPMQDDHSSVGEVLRSDAPTPELQAATRTDLSRAMQQLEPMQRELLWLAYAQGASHDEIAGILGLRVISVRTTLYRARRKLAAILTGSPL